jgi:4-amino-4-deoxy-L-arabinose transferase-like glycosyltransferase
VLSLLRSSKPRTFIRTSDPRRIERLLLLCGAALVCLHAAAMLYRFGSIPNIPVFGDEIVINDPAVALSRGQGLVAPSFVDSVAGIDKVYAHFPPVYIFLQAAVFHVFGISGYSLRILTTVFSIASVTLFLIIAGYLVRQRLMTRRTAVFVGCLYALSAPVIILHRISRMESMIEFLSLISLFSALKLTFPSRVGQRESTIQTRKPYALLLIIAALASGIALAAHPEAVTAVLPSALIILFARGIPPPGKWTFVALLLATPAAIWAFAYGPLWLVALRQMAYIARNKSPDPSMPQFGMDLLRKAASSQHDLMVFLFFSLTVVVLVWAFIQVIRAARSSKETQSPSDPNLRAVENALAIAVPATLAILLFLLPASITRYEVFYPIYLLLIAVLRAPYPNRDGLRPYVSAAVALLIIGQFLACIRYLAENRNSADGPAERYDFVLNCIPSTANVAASPQLWLAFERHNRPFALLYQGLDGLGQWKRHSADPLDRFDVILLTDYIKDDFDLYSALSTSGRIERNIQIGPRILYVYSRPGVMANCTDMRLHAEPQ